MNKPQVVHPYVEVKPHVQGGRPVMEGTRIAVSTIIIWYKQGRTVDEILDLYPELTPAQVYDALSFYHDHQEEMEKEILMLQDEDSWQAKFPGGKD